MVKILAIRFLLEGSHVLDVALPENEARRYVEAWRDKQLGESSKRLGGIDASGRVWAIDSARIQSLFAFDPEEERRKQLEMLAASQQPQNKIVFGSPGNRGGPPGSGVN